MNIPIVPLVVATALFMENTDSTILATALPTIARDLGLDPISLKLAVTAYLVTGGVARGRLEPRGFGKEFPVDDNGSSSGRAANRRTEVVLPQ